jgi:hypothetical protein
MNNDQFTDKAGTTGDIHFRYRVAQALMLNEVFQAAKSMPKQPAYQPVHAPLQAATPIPQTPAHPAGANHTQGTGAGESRPARAAAGTL